MLHSLRLRFTDKPLTLVVTGVEKWAPERSKRHGRRDGSDFQTSGRRLQRRPRTGSADELDGQMDYW